MKRSKQLIEKLSACVAASTVLCVAVTDSAGGVLQAVSTAWSLGGKDLFWMSVKGQRDMFIEQEKLGIIGLPAVQAFK